MARQCFYSFHYIPDCSRASQVRNMGVIDGNKPAHDNDWEQVKRGGDAAIQRWIDGQLSGRSCTVVLVGAATARRKWIDYEIKKSWDEGKGVVGVHIYKLRDFLGQQCVKGDNPFSHFTLKNGSVSLANVVKTYDVPFTDSKVAYKYINDNLSKWVEEAVKIRTNYV